MPTANGYQEGPRPAGLAPHAAAARGVSSRARLARGVVQFAGCARGAAARRRLSALCSSRARAPARALVCSSACLPSCLSVCARVCVYMRARVRVNIFYNATGSILSQRAGRCLCPTRGRRGQAFFKNFPARVLNSPVFCSAFLLRAPPSRLGGPSWLLRFSTGRVGFLGFPGSGLKFPSVLHHFCGLATFACVSGTQQFSALAS